MNDRYLKTGVFLAPFHPERENPLLCLERDMDLLVHLDKLNYSEAWIGEHHSAGFEIITCPEMFIAAAAERTRHIRLGTGVVSLPYHNPFTVAGRMMQLDYMTRGRAMFGVGPGSLVYDATKMGLKAEDQRRKLDESLDVIVELMQGRMVTKKTDWFDMQEARLQLKSYSQPMMEMAVASSRSPDRRARRRQARHRHALHWRHVGRRAEGARQQLGRLRGGSPRQRQDARPPQVAHRHLRPRRRHRGAGCKDVEFGLEDFRRYFTEVATFPIIPPDVTGDPAEYLVSSGLACIGTPEDCIRHFERLWKGSNGGLGGILLLAHNWADWPATLRSYELMARYVHPHFQRNFNELRALELRRRQEEIRHRRPGHEVRRPVRDRQVPGQEGLGSSRRSSPGSSRPCAPSKLSDGSRAQGPG